MKPSVYLECLEYVERRDQLAASQLRPTAETDVLAIERELGAQLPEEYEDFLCEVGCGAEHGGLAWWHHLDVGRSGNVLEVSQRMAQSQVKAMREAGVPVGRYPRHLLVIYDGCDGEVYGFVQQSGKFSDEVFGWDCDEFRLRTVAPAFSSFLEEILDCSVEEMEHAKQHAPAPAAATDEEEHIDLSEIGDPSTLFSA